MTREEIINGLEIYTVGRLKKDRVDITVEELQKFIDAIKALTTKNDLAVDGISRADARSLVIKIDRKYMYGMSDKVFHYLLKGLKELPPVTPQEPQLNKIRAEIAELDNKVCQQFLIEDVDKEVHHAYQDCLGIIDKYKTESKPQESE